MADARDILLVEDSDTQALKLSLLLEQEGLVVCRTASGEEGRARRARVVVAGLREKGAPPT